MAARTQDNFGNDGARAYLNVWIAKLVATITEIMADEERLDADEDGETLLMPSVELLALLCERYALPPPQPDTVKQWSEKYLARFDATFQRLGPTPELTSERRRVIEHTFRWLGSLADTHWGP
jgi:hypothetical protein